MERLPNELIMIILEQLPITGKRNLIRCTNNFNKLYYLMADYERIFIKMINESNYLKKKIRNLSDLEKYTLEAIYDGYANLILKRYVGPFNMMLYKYKELYFQCAIKKRMPILKILIKCNQKHRRQIMYGAAYGNHLKLLKWIYFTA